MERLESQSFVGWSEDAQNGYMTALVTIREAANKPAEKKVSASAAAEVKVLEFLTPFFDANPDITILPLFAWGRYYKYECAGESFESANSEWFQSFGSYEIEHKELKRKHLKIADNAVTAYCGEDDEPWGDFYEKIFIFKRSWYTSVFDDRFGMALVVVRQDDGTLVTEFLGCDSPE